MTDKEFLLRVLEDGQPKSLNEILRRSFDERGHGLTVHSRAADLRKDGYVVKHFTDSGERRGNASLYQLIRTVAPVGYSAVSSAAGLPGELERAPHLFAMSNRPEWA